MSGYNAKNYTEQGGSVTHIGGRLVIEEGADITSLLDAIRNAGRISVMGRTETVLEKPVSELIGEDVRILAGGAAAGTFPYVSGFTGFSRNKPEEQEGWFFPVRLSDEYSGKPITVKRESGGGGTEKTVQDLEWVLRLTDGADTVYSFQTGGEPILTLSFRDAVFEARVQD